MGNHTCNSLNIELPLHIIYNWKKKFITKTRREKPLTTTKQQTKNWVTFFYNSPLTRKINDLFKHTNLDIALTCHKNYTSATYWQNC